MSGQCFKIGIIHRGETLTYIEVTKADIALANRIAHEVLGRTLDELPPQTRRLLTMVQAWVSERCSATAQKQSEFRFTRRDVREATRWGDTQLKVHLARLVELEYVLTHRGLRGLTHEYELRYDGVDDGRPHLMGLLDLQTLDAPKEVPLGDNDADRSGQNDERSGFLEWLRERNYSDMGIRNRETNLRAFVAWCDERGVTRPQEVTRQVALEVDAIDHERGTLMVRQGKGKRDRMVPIGERALAWIRKYLDEVRPQLMLGDGSRVLYLTRHGEALSVGEAGRMVSECIKRSGLEKSGSCHLFRHTMATLMLENGADVRFVQAMLGQADLKTTQIYTHVAIRALKEVHSATHPARLQRASRDEAQDNAVLHRPLWRVRPRAVDATTGDEVEPVNEGVALLRNGR